MENTVTGLIVVIAMGLFGVSINIALAGSSIAKAIRETRNEHKG